MPHDIIGDIHGHADKLVALLGKLGYHRRNGAWRHPSRTAILVGDLVDRGPGQVATLELVRDMIEAGSARAVMGNHEFNAIAWAAGLRPHSAKNRGQHEAFLLEVIEDSVHHRAWVNWFRELPVWIEEPGFRVVHACWSPAHVEALRPHLGEGEQLTAEVVEAATQKGHRLYDAIEVLLKGVEVKLPAGVTFKDKEGHPRDAMRTKWWDPALTTYASAYMGPPDAKIPNIPIADHEPIPIPDRPTFIGHYWLPPNDPRAPLSPRVVCVDYSVARGGPLVAYRFDGEAELSAEKFVEV
jgi:hypothetical protein